MLISRTSSVARFGALVCLGRPSPSVCFCPNGERAPPIQTETKDRRRRGGGGGGGGGGGRRRKPGRERREPETSMASVSPLIYCSQHGGSMRANQPTPPVLRVFPDDQPSRSFSRRTQQVPRRVSLRRGRCILPPRSMALRRFRLFPSSSTLFNDVFDTSSRSGKICISLTRFIFFTSLPLLHTL